MFVVHVHNNSVGSSYNVATEEAGIALIIHLAQKQLDRDLLPNEIEAVQNNLEFIEDEEDPDNHNSWSICFPTDYEEEEE